MRFDYPMRVKAATVFLLLAVLCGGVTVVLGAGEQKARRDMASAKVPRGAGGDSITVYESRFEGLKRTLPPDSVVGYVTDETVGSASNYLVTQYALSPVIVRRTLKSDLVVGNFHDPLRMAEIVRSEGLVPVKDYRNGVVLLRGKTK